MDLQERAGPRRRSPRAGSQVHYTTVAALLRSLGDSLSPIARRWRARSILIASAVSPDQRQGRQRRSPRASRRSRFIEKKELVGEFANRGREWRPSGSRSGPDARLPSQATGKAIPYGVYDIAANEGFVNVDHGQDRPAGGRIDQGVVGGPRSRALPHRDQPADHRRLRRRQRQPHRLWKTELGRLADDTGLEICVSHFPPGTSKWNRIEPGFLPHHQTWREPQVSYAVSSTHSQRRRQPGPESLRPPRRARVPKESQDH